MSFFEFNKNHIKYGVIVDIGSGSVLTAIIGSDSTKSYPSIIWSKREQTTLRQITSISDSAKSVMTSLMNAFMNLDSEGRKIFYEKTKKQKFSSIQVTIAAPWSYTVTKTISYQNKDDFEITQTLINELIRTAQKKVTEELKENEKVHNLGLKVVTKTTMKLIANGYPILLTNKQKAHVLNIVETSAVAQEYLTNAIKDAREKMFPNTDLETYSFMLPFYSVIKDINQSTTEYCLIDITYEATEIGVVRDGILYYCSHIPYGSFSIARELSKALSIPLVEAYGYLTSPDISNYLEKYTEGQVSEVQNILLAYQSKLCELFKETGDSLVIPGNIFLHVNLKTEPFFNKQVLGAANLSTKTRAAVYNVTSELITKHYPEDVIKKLKKEEQDTALLISAQFFHTNAYSDKFDHL